MTHFFLLDFHVTRHFTHQFGGLNGHINTNFAIFLQFYAEIKYSCTELTLHLTNKYIPLATMLDLFNRVHR